MKCLITKKDVSKGFIWNESKVQHEFSNCAINSATSTMRTSVRYYSMFAYRITSTLGTDFIDSSSSGVEDEVLETWPRVETSN